MENKQTAVEWLEEQFEESYSYINEIFKETIEQAKEMHKEETCQFVSDYLDDGQDLTAEEYYDQIFKPEKL
jgi:inactivated superfamily I helicase